MQRWLQRANDSGSLAPIQQMEWIRENRPERKLVGYDGVVPPLSKKRVSHKPYIESWTF